MRRAASAPLREYRPFLLLAQGGVEEPCPSLRTSCSTSTPCLTAASAGCWLPCCNAETLPELAGTCDNRPDELEDLAHWRSREVSARILRVRKGGRRGRGEGVCRCFVPQSQLPSRARARAPAQKQRRCLAPTAGAGPGRVGGPSHTTAAQQAKNDDLPGLKFQGHFRAYAAMTVLIAVLTPNRLPQPAGMIIFRKHSSCPAPMPWRHGSRRSLCRCAGRSWIGWPRSVTITG